MTRLVTGELLIPAIVESLRWRSRQPGLVGSYLGILVQSLFLNRSTLAILIEDGVLYSRFQAGSSEISPTRGAFPPHMGHFPHTEGSVGGVDRRSEEHTSELQ